MTWQPWTLTTGEPYRLVIHEWDRIGPPPPVGPDYETAQLEAVLAYVEELLRADELREEADRLRENAEEAEDDADRAERKANDTHKAVAADHPKLAEAVKADPDRFRSISAIRQWIDS